MDRFISNLVRKAFPIFGSLLILVCLSGCGTVRYLFQASKGQLELSNRAQPIAQVLENERTSPELKRLLERIPEMKNFAEAHGIKPTKNYTEYVQLNRTAASYVVSACRPLQFESKKWSFPIVGSFPYLGWFNVEDAKEYAEELKKENWDVDLRGARAFSTLGWFRDPVLSTMIPEGDEALGELADVIIHESVHATKYVNGQSYFNESLASFVAERLAPIYLERVRGKDSVEYKAYVEAQKDYALREKLMHEAYINLEKLYASEKSDEVKLQEKKALLDELKQKVKAKRDINNATLIQFKTYGTGMAEFEALLKTCQSDWQRFLTSLNRIDRSSFSESQQEDLKAVILPLVKDGCPSGS